MINAMNPASLTPRVTPVMTPPQDQLRIASAATQDPWDWTVDDVVASLCGRNHPLLASLDPRSLPEAAHLETALRDNGVSGPTLLLELDHASLRDDLGIRALGPRGTIVQLIKKLRRQSQKYLDQMYEEAVDTPLPGYGRILSVDQQTRLGSSYFGSPPQHAPRAMSIASGVLRSPFAMEGRFEHPLPPPSAAEDVLTIGVRRDEQAQNVLPEAPSLPHPVSQIVRSADMSGENNTPNDAVMTLTLPEHDEARKDPEAIGFGAKEETVFEDSTMFTRPRAYPEPSHRQGETFVVDESGKKRRKLVLGSAELANPPEHNELAISRTAERTIESSHHETPKDADADTTTKVGNGEEVSTDQNLGASHIANSPEVDRIEVIEGSHMSSQADKTSTDTMEVLPEPGTLIIDSQGRKRMRPILMSQPEPLPELDATPLDQMSHNVLSTGDTHPSTSSDTISGNPTIQNRKPAIRKPEDVYLGLEPFPVDKIFYGDTMLGKELENDSRHDDALCPHEKNDSDIFAFSSFNQESSGQRQYVNARVKHFLCAGHIDIHARNGEKLVGVVPYPSQIARSHQRLSITLFARSNASITVSRADRSKWLKYNLSYPTLGRNSRVDPASSTSALPDSSFAHHEENAGDWDYLEKWKYAEGDQVLPAYGDSGSDGEYDMDTWLEMEKEKGSLERPVGRRERERLSDKVVQVTIDEILEQMVRDWHTREESKLQPKAWRLWTKSRRDGDKQEQIRSFADDIEKLDRRLIKLRERIADEEWSAKKELLKQCKIMQPSVYDRELCKWKRSTLNLKSAPEKLTLPARKPKSSTVPSIIASLGEDEEDLASEASDTEGLESDLDDFIVDGDANERPLIDNEIVMPDIGDDTSLADDEANLEPIVSPKVKARLDTQTAEKASNTSVVALLKSPSKQFPDIIDLTQQSDTDELDVPVPKVEPSSAIRTPPLYPSDDDPFIRSRRQKPEFKLPPVADSIIDLVSDPVYVTAEEDSPSPSPIQLPELKDVDGIRKFDPQILVERGDRKRLLLHHISRTPDLERDLVFIHLQEISETELETAVRAGLKAMKSHSHRIRGVDKEDSDVIMRVAGWWVCWTIPVIVGSKGIRLHHIDIVLADKEGFHHFYDFLITCPELFEKESVPEVVSLESDSLTSIKKRQKLLLEGPDEGLQNTPNKKRKYALPESQTTLDLRASAQQRVRDRDRRQKELKHKFKNMNANEDPSKVVVNTGKFDHQDFIYLNPYIGDRIQPHQIDGVQFMWREITTDPENLQGCLLAQTMGLGKTMQVITLLVTIAEASQSSNENIRNQIPSELRNSQTLILCPPALIENWWEEFLMWTPTLRGTNVSAVGEIRKVTTTLKPSERLWEIKAWIDEGGVLLMGFNTFRACIENKVRKSHGDRMLTEAQHRMVMEALLVRPAIVVADEAHAMKNASTGINAAMSRIETKSRIALTGSPLMNNLGEYYSLIEWIAPNFLGTRPEFRANFEEPIQEGFYQDSTHSQYRWAMKKLAALKTDLDPKTHRADISVLKGRLKEKQEFVIRVPLTKLQEQIYRIYVDCMLSASKENEPNVATLWAWLATLRLLCNHPKCFKDRLLAREKEARKTTAFPGKEEKPPGSGASKEELSPLNEDAALLDEPVSAIGITKTMIQRQLTPFDTLTEPLESITLAYKMQILTEILQFCKEAQDKVLVFSHSIPTLDFVENFLRKSGRSFTRIDGMTNVGSRQQLTKDFNKGTSEVFLISTKSGGQGLNMFGANRVVILDDNFNPMYEEQAVGRAYRLGQTKPVFVYYLTVAGTFEDSIKNQSLFKQQLAKRVVDSKNPIRRATKGVGEYLFPPRAVDQEDLGEFIGKDPMVLDRILAKHKQSPIIRSMDLTETFHQEDEMKLTDEEKKEAEQMQKDEQLRRRNPGAYNAMLVARREEEWRSRRISTAQANSWAATSASRPFSTQGSLTSPHFESVEYALLHGAPPSTAPAMTNPLPTTVGTTIAADGHVADLGSTSKARPGASLPPEKHKTVDEKLSRGVIEQSENPTASLGPSSTPKPFLDSRLNSMASPDSIATTSTSLGGQDRTTTEGETDTNKETSGVEEQGSVDDNTVSLKRKRKVDTMSSSTRPGPVTTMFDRLLMREANR